VAARLKIFPNGATPCAIWLNRRRQPLGLHPIDRNHSARGVILSGSLPPGCELSTMYTAGVTTQAATEKQARS